MSCRGCRFGWPWARPPATLRSVEASKAVGGRGSDYARAGRGGRGGGCCAAAADRVPGRVICLPAPSRGCAVRAGGRGADQDRSGGFAGGAVRGEGVPSWSRRPVRRAGLRGYRSGGAGRSARALMGGGGRGTAEERGGCLAVAQARRGDLRGTLPRLRLVPLRRRTQDHSRLAVLLRRR